MKKKDTTKTHYTESYLLAPQHPVTVTLVGCGGTGSQMLNNLARIHLALIALGHPGLHVTAWDNDEITEANLGRQLFSPSELGMNKAVALITRLNRFFGLQWQAQPQALKMKENNIEGNGNIVITAVDKVSLREEIGKVYRVGRGMKPDTHWGRPEQINYYWMDLGNSHNIGQVVIGTRYNIKQPKGVKNTVGSLPAITELHPDLKKHESLDATPSCSLAEALTRQDLFINSILAQYGANILWKMFRELQIKYHGLYLNLQTLQTSPIKV